MSAQASQSRWVVVAAMVAIPWPLQALPAEAEVLAPLAAHEPCDDAATAVAWPPMQQASPLLEAATAALVFLEAALVAAAEALTPVVLLSSQADDTVAVAATRGSASTAQTSRASFIVTSGCLAARGRAPPRLCYRPGRQKGCQPGPMPVSPNCKKEGVPEGPWRPSEGPFRGSGAAARLGSMPHGVRSVPVAVNVR